MEIDNIRYNLLGIALSILLVVLFHSNTNNLDLIVMGSSMEPTYKTGDSLKIKAYTEWTRHPSIMNFKRGDIMVFKEPNKINSVLIKRVIAVPGDTITHCDGRTYINGVSYKDKLGENEEINIEASLSDLNLDKIHLKENEYWVVSDNKQIQTIDSEILGPIEAQYIIGKGR